MSYVERVVGIDDQRVVAFVACQLQRLGAVVREIPPWPLVQLARQVAQVLADDLLGAVGGSGVGDHPAIDHRAHAVETPANHQRLALDNHVQANHLPKGIHVALRVCGGQR